ncbi:MAG: peptidylprolyl isomerase [Pseudomonadota bacterium]
MRKRSSIWRDPFVLFAIGGVALFLIAAAVERSAEEGATRLPRQLLITHAKQEELRTQFERANGRAPTAEEHAAAVERHVRERILFEQAVAWDMHRNDVVVRRRLVERVRMLFGNYAPTDRDETDLQATYEQYKERFLAPASIGFRQIFIDRDVHGEDALEHARALKETLRETGSAEGDLWYQAPTEPPRSLPRISALMGQDFAAALDLLPAGEWSPPVASSYGYHLVFIEEKTPARQVPLEEVLEQVWVLHRRERERASFATFSDRLRARYEVTIEPPPASASDGAR